MFKRFFSILLIIILLLIGAVFIYASYIRRIKLSETSPAIEKPREAKALTVFFGLDELPVFATLLYIKATGKNGMPIVLSQEVDPSTLDNTDFEVTTENGEKYNVEFVTLKPANEEFELRTVLFIGEYGSHPDNPPVSVGIVGDLMSRSGQNFKGQTLEVIPLPDGPTISYAEYFVFDDDYPYVKSGQGCDCPKEGTAMVVRTVWAGGVRATNGQELGDNELESFHVTMVQGSDTVVVKPYMLADLGDNDNNIDLCLKVEGRPILVEADAGIAIDPRGDVNPETKAEVLSRW
jgi:hypothetical protein